MPKSSPEMILTAQGRAHNVLAQLNNVGVKYLSPADPREYMSVDQKYSMPYEVFQPNQLYGLSTIFRISYNLKSSPIYAVLPHGISDSPVIWSKELLCGLPYVCYSDYSTAVSLNVAQKLNVPVNIYQIPHPFFTLSSKLKFKDTVNKGAIFFHVHSSFSEDADLSKSTQEYLTASVNEMRTIYDRVSICLYYIDYIRLLGSGKYVQLKSLFDEVYCCGSRYDPSFMIKLLYLMRSHSCLIADGIGSHVYYAAMAGIEVHLLPPRKSTYLVKDSLHDKRKDGDVRKYMHTIAYERHNHYRLCSRQDLGRTLARFFNSASMSPDAAAGNVSKLLKTPKGYNSLSPKLHDSNHIYPLVCADLGIW